MADKNKRKMRPEDGVLRAHEPKEKLSGKGYREELARLHGELVKLQLWVVKKA